MANLPNQSENVGSFVPTTNIWDVAQLEEIDVTSGDFKELLVRLYQNINNIAIVLNNKDSGYYIQEVFNTSNTFFTVAPTVNNQDDLRPVFRKVVNFGALPNTGTKSVAHGISIAPFTILGANPFSFTRIYGCASKTTTAGIGLNYIPLPYVSQVANDSIELFVDATNVTVITASNYSEWAITYIVVEFLKY